MRKSLAQLSSPHLFPEQVTPEEKRLSRIAMLLKALPFEDDEDREWEWNRLTSWEQEFLSSIRGYFERNNTLSKRQEAVLEDLWEKVNEDPVRCGWSKRR